ncbi:hypothetical protein EHM69_04875 [candidate division KSB1 bacterium]|nr:MAG: hypothetical protein EHM69_04875 [candidate division KSB1 bacterium]
MGRHWHVLACLILLLPQILRADPFSDFRIPAHRVYLVNASVYGWGDNSYDSDDRSKYRSWKLRGSVSNQGKWLYDSDPLRLDVNLALYASGEKTESRGTYVFRDSSTGRSHNITERGSEYWDITASSRYYPWTFPLGMDLTANGRGSFGQEQNNRYIRGGEYTPERMDRSFDEEYSMQYSATGSFTMGFGRVRDASSVFEIFVLENRLLELGILTRNLKPETRQRLAQYLIAGLDHFTLHDRPIKYFWQDVERILHDDGALCETGLDGYSLCRIAEPYTTAKYNSSSSELPRSLLPTSYANRIVRNSGWFAGMAMKWDHNHYIMRGFQATQWSSSSWRNEGFSDYFSVGPTVQYCRPIGWKWQVDFKSSVSFPQNDAPQAIDATTDGTLTYVIADRWLSTIKAVHIRKIVNETHGFERNPPYAIFSSWSANVGVNLFFFVEDRLALTLRLKHQQGRYCRDYSSPVYPTRKNYYRDNSIEIGISCNFLGMLEAPGLIPRSTLPPMDWPFK